MGFLDAKQRVLDVALTEHGRRQYAAGKLRFVYFSLHDDLVDYDPFIPSSGSYSSAAISDIISSCIEESPMLEPPTVPMRAVLSTGRSALLPRSTIFGASDGYSIVPMADVSPTASLIEGPQASNELGRAVSYRRDGSTALLVHLDHVGDLPSTAGVEYKVEAFLSSSDGLVPQEARTDLKGRPSLGMFIVAVPGGSE